MESGTKLASAWGGTMGGGGGQDIKFADGVFPKSPGLTVPVRVSADELVGGCSSLSLDCAIRFRASLIVDRFPFTLSPAFLRMLSYKYNILLLLILIAGNITVIVLHVLKKNWFALH